MTVLQWKSRWIHKLKATQSPGLNEILSYRPFLDGLALYVEKQYI